MVTMASTLALVIWKPWVCFSFVCQHVPVKEKKIFFQIACHHSEFVGQKMSQHPCLLLGRQHEDWMVAMWDLGVLYPDGVSSYSCNQPLVCLTQTELFTGHNVLVECSQQCNTTFSQVVIFHPHSHWCIVPSA